jgi:hypothetical protein
MIVSEQKPIEEILVILKEEKNIFMAVCNGCAEVCKTGGEEGYQNGKNISGYVIIDFMCNKALDLIRMGRHAPEIEKADAIAALTCGIGVQALANVSGKYVYTTSNTRFIGGFQGTWPSSERCAECGDCILYQTGGICPYTNCTKGLLNGPCGGSKNGKCEIDKDTDCCWEKVYARLSKLGKLEKMRVEPKLRDYSKMLTPNELKKTSNYDVEFGEPK